MKGCSEVATEIVSKNFKRQPVDCTEYSGDLIFNGCNISQQSPDTAQVDIFINIDNVTSIHCVGCNCTNHSLSPPPQVTYEKCNLGQFDYDNQFEIQNLGIADKAAHHLRTIWRWLVSYVVANQTATFGQMVAAFDVQFPDSPFDITKLMAAVLVEIQKQYPNVDSWAQIRDFIIQYKDEGPMGGVL